MPSWFSSSYMARRGVAAGRAGKTHRLTEAKQGSYQYVYGPYAAPVLTIAPGDVVVAETLDAFGGAIKSVDDKPSEKLNFPFVNPQNGPIAVEGAEKGDVLCVRIETIVPRGPQPVGHLRAHPRIRRPGRQRRHADAQSAPARAGDEIPRERKRRALQRPDHPALRALHRHARGQPSDRSGAVAAARLLGRQHGPARRRSRRDRLFPGADERGQSLSRRLPRPAGRRRTLRRRRRDPVDHHDPGRSHQVVGDSVAAARERALRS